MSTATHSSWSGHAFGLTVHSDFALPGLRKHRAIATGERPLHIGLLAGGAVDESRVGERLCEGRDDAGRLILAIDRGAAAYSFLAPGVGTYELSDDGERLRCRPLAGAGLVWRRFLTGQVLPFAALLQGLEVFHASAVEIDGRAVAISGVSGAGKSTLALELHLGGAGFVTDDVLALEIRDGEVLAHPGVGMAKVRRLSGGRVLEAWRPVTPAPGPVPLVAFCVIERNGTSHLRIVDGAPSSRYLLGSTFNLVLATPARLRTQLDVCATIAQQARLLRAAVPDRLDATVAAELRHALVAAPAVA